MKDSLGARLGKGMHAQGSLVQLEKGVMLQADRAILRRASAAYTIPTGTRESQAMRSQRLTVEVAGCPTVTTL